MIGHNCMYDIIYFYNQFIGPLPDTYEQFIKSWSSHFHTLYDTKILTSNANYFGSTTLGKVQQKCENDHRLADILKIRYDKRIK